MRGKTEAPKKRMWNVQVEFLDGTIIDAISDEDAVERWRRLAAWTDTTVETDPEAWMDRVLARARVVYGAQFPSGLNGSAPAPMILNALDDAECLIVRRK